MALGTVNTGGGSGTKSILIVTAPTGSTVTVTKESVTKAAAEKNGEWWFKNLENGEWTITATLGGQKATKTVSITQFSVYRTSIAYFEATINVTYPAGGTCTVTDGTTTLRSPNTSGVWACVVPNAGTWTVTANNSPLSERVSISSNGQSVSIDLTKRYAVNNGNGMDSFTGGWSKGGTGNATVSSNGGLLKYEVSSGLYSVGAANVVTTYMENSAEIDVTNFKTLSIEIPHIYLGPMASSNAAKSGNSIEFIILKGNSEVLKRTLASNVSTSGKTTSYNGNVDLSNINGKVKFKFFTAAYEYNSYITFSQKLHVKNMILKI